MKKSRDYNVYYEQPGDLQKVAHLFIKINV